MDGERFSRAAPAGGGGARRRWTLGSMLSTALAGLLPGRLAAQDETVSAGSGGTATANANGGAVALGDINSGGNVGNVISVGSTTGSVWVDGGDVANSTTVGITASGGTAIADASGGDYNLAFLS